MSGIDAPEKRQPFGQAAKQALSDMAFARFVHVTWQKRDRNNRIVGTVERGGADLGLALVEQGMAWHYKRYESEQLPADRTTYRRAEAVARTARRGLWSDKDPVAPWKYRKRRRASQGRALSADPVGEETAVRTLLARRHRRWMGMAIGRRGDAVAPRSFRGEAMNRNSYT